MRPLVARSATTATSDPATMTGLIPEQFELMGREDARDLATTFVSVYQGASPLANACRDPSILAVQAAWPRRWVDSLT